MQITRDDVKHSKMTSPGDRRPETPVISPAMLLSVVGNMTEKLVRNVSQCCKYLLQNHVTTS